MILLLHGGAAKDDPKRMEHKIKAADTSANMVNTSLSALDMVEAAVNKMEENSIFNAGLGSVIQLDGRIRMDAGICTSDGRYGAVIQIENVIYPISVARKVLNAGYHSILSGNGATNFARENGFPSISPYTERTLSDYVAIRSDLKELTYDALANDVKATNIKKLSTVGAVAIDDNGFMAAACSTGGTKYCYPGRVGDTPIFGAGVYCSDVIAAACTGEGDKVLRRLTCKRVEDIYLRNGKNLQAACDEAIADLFDKEAGYGGIIAVSQDGQHGRASAKGLYMATSLVLKQ